MPLAHAQRQSGLPRLAELLLPLHPFVGVPDLVLRIAPPPLGGLEGIEIFVHRCIRISFKVTHGRRAGKRHIGIHRIRCDPLNHARRVLRHRHRHAPLKQRTAQIPFLHKVTLNRVARGLRIADAGEVAVKIPPGCGKNLTVPHHLRPKKHRLQDR